jgi:hypothetical protein
MRIDHRECECFQGISLFKCDAQGTDLTSAGHATTFQTKAGRKGDHCPTEKYRLGNQQLEPGETVQPAVAPETGDAALEIEYVELPNFPGMKVFRCERLRADLTAASCARNFRESSTLSCVGCNIGRGHATRSGTGVSSEKAGKRTAWSLTNGGGVARWDEPVALSCVRCERTGRTEGTRLLGRLRLVRDHCLCVSCFNREREIVLGKNAKGARPKKWAGLRLSIVRINTAGKSRLLDIGLCSGRPEADRMVQRRWPRSKLTGFWQDRDLPKPCTTLRTSPPSSTRWI